MEIFWRLVLGHLIADFTLQTNYIAAWKRRNIWGLLVHCGTHPIVYSLLLWSYLGQVWLKVGPIELTGCTCIFLVFFTHFIEDEWRIWSVLKKGSPDNTIFYLWDQAIHYAVLFAFSPVIDGFTGKFGWFEYPVIQGVVSASVASGMGMIERFFTIVRSEVWVPVGILLAVVTHFTTVTIYFLEKDLFGLDFPSDQEKYISMAERLVVTACFLLPGFWWVTVLAVWLLRTILYKTCHICNFTWINIILGNVTAILCGLLIRCFLNP